MGKDSTRDRMVRAAQRLFRDQGYDGTGFRDVVEAAGTTQGVIYHHFPGGKTELGEAVAVAVGDRMATGVEAICAAMNPKDAVTGLLGIVEQNLLVGELRPGCPILALAFAADDPDGRLRAASDSFFTRIRTALRECLVRDSVDRADAEAFAALALSACEGALILSRARRDTEPFTAMQTALLQQVDQLTGKERP